DLAALFLGDDLHDLPAGLGMDFPARQVLAVEELYPARVVLVVGHRRPAHARDECEAEHKDAPTYPALLHDDHSWSYGKPIHESPRHKPEARAKPPSLALQACGIEIPTPV